MAFVAGTHPSISSTQCLLLTSLTAIAAAETLFSFQHGPGCGATERRLYVLFILPSSQPSLTLLTVWVVASATPSGLDTGLATHCHPHYSQPRRNTSCTSAGDDSVWPRPKIFTKSRSCRLRYRRSVPHRTIFFCYRAGPKFVTACPFSQDCLLTSTRQVDSDGITVGVVGS